MAPHSSTLAWKIPWMEEPGRLQSMGLLELDITEQLHFHFSLSCIGEGNGNPLQCSCQENPRDRKPGGLPSMGSQRVGHDWVTDLIWYLYKMMTKKNVKCNSKNETGRDFWHRVCSKRRRRWHPTPVLVPGKSHGRRSLVGCSPGGREESDITEQLHFHFSLSCIGEGNGNPL